MTEPYALPLFGLVARSGTGKTSLLEQLIPLLGARGVRVSLIKHSHHSVDLDTPGKDSHRLREAGAAQVMLASRDRWALLTETPGQAEPELAELVSQLDKQRCDLVLVEGFKHQPYPRIELHRAELGQPLLALHDGSIVAVAANCPAPDAFDRAWLDLDKPAEIVDFLLGHLHLKMPPEHPSNNQTGGEESPAALVSDTTLGVPSHE